MSDKALPLGDVIAQLTKSNRWQERFDRVTVVQDWEQIVGPMIAGQTQDVYLGNGKLLVSLTSAPLREELRRAKEVIIEKVNHHLGRDVVRQLILR